MTTSRQPSKLTSLVFERLDDESNVSVFDTGLAVAETVNFFASYKCRLYFTDLYSETLVCQQDDDLSEAEICARFDKLFDFPTDTRFDICLFWDFLNYLTAPYLRAFSRALRPYIHPGTIAHGFGVLNTSTTLKNQLYGIASRDELVIRPRPNNALKCYPHPQAELDKLLPDFTIGHSLLLAGGQLEMLLNTKQ